MLKNLLVTHKAAILGRWRELIRETYPPQTARFLHLESDRFHNPVGYALATDIEKLYDFLISGKRLEDPSELAEMLIKIRAVQDLTPSVAIGFVYLLKTAVYEHLDVAPDRDGMSLELRDFEERVDRVALCMFDAYMRCRETIQQLRTGASRRQSFGARQHRCDPERAGGRHE